MRHGGGAARPRGAPGPPLLTEQTRPGRPKHGIADTPLDGGRPSPLRPPDHHPAPVPPATASNRFTVTVPAALRAFAAPPLPAAPVHHHRFAGTVPAWQGIAAFGDTLMECRRRLQSTRDDWLLRPSDRPAGAPAGGAVAKGASRAGFRRTNRAPVSYGFRAGGLRRRGRCGGMVSGCTTRRTRSCSPTPATFPGPVRPPPLEPVEPAGVAGFHVAGQFAGSAHALTGGAHTACPAGASGGATLAVRGCTALAALVPAPARAVQPRAAAAAAPAAPAAPRLIAVRRGRAHGISRLRCRWCGCGRGREAVRGREEGGWDEADSSAGRAGPVDGGRERMELARGR